MMGGVEGITERYADLRALVRVLSESAEEAAKAADRSTSSSCSALPHSLALSSSLLVSPTSRLVASSSVHRLICTPCRSLLTTRSLCCRRTSARAPA